MNQRILISVAATAVIVTGTVAMLAFDFGGSLTFLDVIAMITAITVLCVRFWLTGRTFRPVRTSPISARPIPEVGTRRPRRVRRQAVPSRARAGLQPPVRKGLSESPVHSAAFQPTSHKRH